MINYKIDHLVVGSNNLDEGTQYIEKLLKVKLSKIGKHRNFGTHNRVLSLGGIYLEVIAIDDQSDFKPINCWFSLDQDYVKQKILKKPTLISFVISSKKNEDLRTHESAIFVERDHYFWNFRKPKTNLIDNVLFPYEDIFPSLIYWFSDLPISNMNKNFLSFQSLDITLSKDQNFYKKFLSNFNLNEKINFLTKNNIDPKLLPNLSAEIINTKSGEKFTLT